MVEDAGGESELQMKCLFLKRLELSVHTFKIIFEEYGFHGNSPLTFWLVVQNDGNASSLLGVVRWKITLKSYKTKQTHGQ